MTPRQTQTTVGGRQVQGDEAWSFPYPEWLDLAVTMSFDPPPLLADLRVGNEHMPEFADTPTVVEGQHGPA